MLEPVTVCLALAVAQAVGGAVDGSPGWDGSPGRDGPQVDDLRVGHWVRVKGNTDATGTLVADEVEIRDPEERNEIIGTVRAVEPDDDAYAVLDVDGQLVFVGPKCRLRGFDTSVLDDLAGVRVGVEGYWRSPWKFSARELELRDKGRDRLEGRIDAIDRSATVSTLTVMGRSVVLAPGVMIEVAGDLTEMGLADAVDYDAPINADREFDDDDDIPGRQIAPGLWTGARLEWRRTDEREFDLDKPDVDDRVDDDLSIRGEVRWEPSDRLFGLVEYRHAWRRRSDDQDGDSSLNGGRLNEAHFYFRDVMMQGLDLQLGRQDFDEPREWLYDENLDAARAILSRSSMRLELFAATVLAGGEVEDEETSTYGALLRSVTNRDWTVGAYAIHRESDFGTRREATHTGFRALGEFVDQHESWAELAFLTGQESGIHLASWAFDVGTTWSPRALDRWYLTAGFAYGAGDEGLADGEDSTFRQTGLHDNNAKFGGVTSFRYYGELFDPELSNLKVATLGIGRRFRERDSIDFVLHKYDQDVVNPYIVDSQIKAAPSGLSRDLGWEADLIYGSRTNDRVSLEVVLGRFEPGQAFPDADPAWILKLQIRTEL